MNAEDFMGRAVPADTTLGTLKAYFDNGPEAATLRAASRNGRVRIRFLRSADDAELPNDMTIGEFRRLVRAKAAHVAVDDGTGGVAALEPA